MNGIHSNPESFLLELFDAAVQAACPHNVFVQHLPENTSAKAVVLGAGKAAASMASALEEVWQGPLSGLVVTPYGYTAGCNRVEVVEAAHPVPDGTSESIAKRIFALASDLTAEEQVICLISGGGSALLSLPAPKISFEEKQQVNRALLKCGATIAEINCVRKHLSAIKGGRLARACSPARVFTYAISDVPGDHAQAIASGPTVADSSTSEQALGVLRKYGITVSKNIVSWLNSAESETLKPDDPVFNRTGFKLIATPQQSLEAAAEYSRSVGIPALILSDRIEGESREVAKVHSAIAQQVSKAGNPSGVPCVILSGGETTVTVRGSGRGGRNTEFLLGLLACLEGHPKVYALAADTDGIDGSEDNAGAFIKPETWELARKLALEPSKFLENNDGYGFFSRTNSLVTTGPTRTNVNDFRALLVL